MDILSDAQYEVLTFVGACNRNFYNPTAMQVMLWRSNRRPEQAVYRTVRRQFGPAVDLTAPLHGMDTASDRMAASLWGDALRPLQDAFASIAKQLAPLGSGGSKVRYVQELVKPAETEVAHLLRLTWLEEVPAPHGGEAGLRLTDLGRALLRDAESDEESDEDVSVVVLGREDPLAYPILVGQFAVAGAGLLVDPYLKLADLHTIVVSTQLTRLLVSGKPNNRGVVASMEAYLGSQSLPRPVEVRSSIGLHDRVLIADEGDVLTVGTSLNGIGRTTTVMTPIPSPARESLRNEYERLWREATLVGPTPAEDEADEPSDSAPRSRGPGLHPPDLHAPAANE
ncbi:hypothetical protein [Micromonospora sp. CMU55-4]|uniref:hypothetical protein n=1 Tax=Micromonospora sp. CMU55-4 TaxID=2717028 RepID=UPI00140D715A|nr:hypothetical protein [Micromonospora sp. CMU55-4]NHO84863.1 hypothetical protein [Micromonospora sp. CMU55-4]